MSVTGVRRFCWALSWLALSACQGMVLNPHGEDPSIDPVSPAGPAGEGVSQPGAEPGTGVVVDGNPVITDPSEPEVNVPGVPSVPPTDEADPVFSQPDSGAPATTLAIDGGTAPEEADARARTPCENEQDEECDEGTHRPHQDAGAFAE